MKSFESELGGFAPDREARVRELEGLLEKQADLLGKYAPEGPEADADKFRAVEERIARVKEEIGLLESTTESVPEDVRRAIEGAEALINDSMNSSHESLKMSYQVLSALLQDIRRNELKVSEATKDQLVSLTDTLDKRLDESIESASAGKSTSNPYDKVGKNVGSNAPEHRWHEEPRRRGTDANPGF